MITFSLHNQRIMGDLIKTLLKFNNSNSKPICSKLRDGNKRKRDETKKTETQRRDGGEGCPSLEQTPAHSGMKLETKVHRKPEKRCRSVQQTPGQREMKLKG